MEQKQLNFAEQAVQVLTLGELERSYHENLPTGDPVGGIYHFALIQQVLAIFEKRGLTPVVQEIFAAANRDSKRPGVTLLPQLEEQYGERSIEAHLLSVLLRLICCDVCMRTSRFALMRRMNW